MTCFVAPSLLYCIPALATMYRALADTPDAYLLPVSAATAGMY